MASLFIVAKRTFRFTHPNYLNADKRAETIAQVEGRSVREMREVLGGSRAPSTAVMPGQILVRANPVEIQEVPEWVTEDPLFGLAIKDGTIRLMRSKGDRDAVRNPEIAGFKTPPSGLPGQEAKVVDDDDTGEGKKIDGGPDLDSMTKAELVDHAKAVHGLELDPSQKKDELIAAINEAQDSKG